MGASRVDRRRWIGPGKLAAKLAVGALVVVAVGRHVVVTGRDFRATGRGLSVDWAWASATCGAYLAGLSCFGLYYGRVVGMPPGPPLRAYLVSHLAKYVPGKAMVVVVRAGMLAREGVRPARAAFATLYETLVMMAAGGLVAALGFALAPAPTPLYPALASLGLGMGFLALVLPGAFPRVSKAFRAPFPNVGPDALPDLSARRLAEGLLLAVAGWTLLGMSQLAAIRALFPEGVAPGRWPLVVAGVALATVLGFVSGLPGGAFVREWVLLKTLTPAVGQDRAVVSALALRLAWVLAEACAAAVLLATRPRARGAA